MRRRTLRDDERELWMRCVRDVTPLGRPAPDTRPGESDIPAQNAAEAPSLRTTNAHAPRPLPPTPGLKASRQANLSPAHLEAPAQGLNVRNPTAPNAIARSRSDAALSIPRTPTSSFLPAAEAAMAAHLRAKASRRAGSGTTGKATVTTPASGIDPRNLRKLATGRVPVERRLDLHGMTAQAAFYRLQAFLHEAYVEGVRCVEIVTGLGSGPEGGILRRELPHWLGRVDLRRVVLAATHSHQANQGAVRLLLRRRDVSPVKKIRNHTASAMTDDEALRNVPPSHAVKKRRRGR
ncbi:Smr/MutS family protein [Acetobacter nitrogenifigens]